LIAGLTLPVVDLNHIEAVGEAVSTYAEPFDSVLAKLEEA
jgi:hypothetical protein